MSLNRYAKRRDENEAEIVAALETIGCTVWRLDNPVDLLVGRGAVNILIEVKDGAKSPSRRRRTPLQRKFMESWKGQVCVVENPLQAISIVTDLTTKNAY